MAVNSSETPTKLSLVLGDKRFLAAFWFAAFCLFTHLSLAQEPATRIATEINNPERVTIPGTHPPIATAANDLDAHRDDDIAATDDDGGEQHRRGNL